MIDVDVHIDTHTHTGRPHAQPAIVTRQLGGPVGAPFRVLRADLILWMRALPLSLGALDERNATDETVAKCKRKNQEKKNSLSLARQERNEIRRNEWRTKRVSRPATAIPYGPPSGKICLAEGGINNKQVDRIFSRLEEAARVTIVLADVLVVKIAQ